MKRKNEPNSQNLISRRKEEVSDGAARALLRERSRKLLSKMVSQIEAFCCNGTRREFLTAAAQTLPIVPVSTLVLHSKLLLRSYLLAEYKLFCSHRPEIDESGKLFAKYRHFLAICKTFGKENSHGGMSLDWLAKFRVRRVVGLSGFVNVNGQEMVSDNLSELDPR